MSFLEISETESVRADYLYDTKSKLCLLVERKGYERLQKLPQDQLLKFDEYGAVYQMLRETMSVVADNNDYVVEFELIEKSKTPRFIDRPHFFENGHIVQFHSENSLEDWPELAALLECDYYNPDPHAREMIEGYVTGVYFEIETGEIYHPIRTHQTDKPRDVIIEPKYLLKIGQNLEQRALFEKCVTLTELEKKQRVTK